MDTGTYQQLPGRRSPTRSLPAPLGAATPRPSAGEWRRRCAGCALSPTWAAAALMWCTMRCTTRRTMCYTTQCTMRCITRCTMRTMRRAMLPAMHCAGALSPAELLQYLPSPERELLYWLCDCAAEVAQHEASNKMHVGAIAVVLPPRLTPTPAPPHPPQLTSLSPQPTPHTHHSHPPLSPTSYATTISPIAL